jgi:hypothetical protein
MFLFNTVYNIRPRGINIKGAIGINKLSQQEVNC